MTERMKKAPQVAGDLSAAEIKSAHTTAAFANELILERKKRFRRDNR